MMDSRCEMPEQVLFDILLWLPVVSLLRFKSVCKSWFTLVDSSHFITQHLHRNCGKDNLIASYRHGRRTHFCLLSGDRYDVYSSLKFEDQWYATTTPGEWFWLVDSCNGIVCLHNEFSLDVALWNPAMKQLRPLPSSSISHRICNVGKIGERMRDVSSGIGFGFDAKANDYKVVRIILQNMPFNQVEVYNLRTSSWRITHKNDTLPFRDIIGRIHAISKSGTCFWAGYDNLDNNNILVSFDLKDEVFETMPLPHDRECDFWYALDFLDDKLAYIKGVNGHPYGHHQYFEIWVLREFGVKKSWNKIYKIEPTQDLGEYICPLGFSMNAEFLLLEAGDFSSNRLYLYNLVIQEEKYLPFQERHSELEKFLHYNESLVSIKKTEEQDFTTVC